MINGARHDELRELKRITTKVFALIDSEKGASTAEVSQDRFAFKEVCEAIGIDCHMTEKRSLENYFPEKDVRKVLGETIGGLAPFDKPDKWSKSENWRIAQSIDWSDLERSDIGEWLERIRDECKKTVPA